MNFKMKALVAAVALTASMSASAAMQNTNTGDSSLILTAYDTTNNISLTVDLGYTLNTFDLTSNASWDISAGNYADAWTTFWGTAAAANVQWAVFAGDRTGGVTAGDQRMLTTVASSTWTNVANSVLANQMAAMDTYINANNALLTNSNHSSVADGASTAISGAAWAETGTVYGISGKINVQGSDTMSVLGTNANIWTIARSGSNNLIASTATKMSNNGFNPYFNLSSNGTLTYTAAVAAVPEADSWAMLLAGLGLMGFIARRRTAA
jgi:hypothetical protein